VGILFVLDPELGSIETPHGRAAFLQMVGITQHELDQLGENSSQTATEQLVAQLKQNNPYLLTDLDRK